MITNEDQNVYLMCEQNARINHINRNKMREKLKGWFYLPCDLFCNLDLGIIASRITSCTPFS